MFISIAIYQLNYKNNQISELNAIVESEREIIKEIVAKEYPKLENKIDDLINFEKCKKENIVLKCKNTGIDYLANKMSHDIKNADTRKYAKKYDELKNEKIKLNTQISNLKSDQLTINVLTNLDQQDKPLHQQIITLEQKVKDNYKNRMILVNRIKKLKTNTKVKYILAKLDKNDAPIQEQISAIDKELHQLNQNKFGKNYNTNTTYVLDNLKQNYKSVGQQIEALKQSLENKKLLLEIEYLKKQLANNLKTKNNNLNTNDLKKALENLQKMQNIATNK
jgi:cell division protein FtsB